MLRFLKLAFTTLLISVKAHGLVRINPDSNYIKIPFEERKSLSYLAEKIGEKRAEHLLRLCGENDINLYDVTFLYRINENDYIASFWRRGLHFVHLPIDSKDEEPYLTSYDLSYDPMVKETIKHKNGQIYLLLKEYDMRKGVVDEQYDLFPVNDSGEKLMILSTAYYLSDGDEERCYVYDEHGRPEPVEKGKIHFIKEYKVLDDRIDLEVVEKNCETKTEKTIFVSAIETDQGFEIRNPLSTQ